MQSTDKGSEELLVLEPISAPRVEDPMNHTLKALMTITNFTDPPNNDMIHIRIGAGAEGKWTPDCANRDVYCCTVDIILHRRRKFYHIVEGLILDISDCEEGILVRLHCDLRG